MNNRRAARSATPAKRQQNIDATDAQSFIGKTSHRWCAAHGCLAFDANHGVRAFVFFPHINKTEEKNIVARCALKSSRPFIEIAPAPSTDTNAISGCRARRVTNSVFVRWHSRSEYGSVIIFFVRLVEKAACPRGAWRSLKRRADNVRAPKALPLVEKLYFHKNHAVVASAHFRRAYAPRRSSSYRAENTSD